MQALCQLSNLIFQTFAPECKMTPRFLTLYQTYQNSCIILFSRNFGGFLSLNKEGGEGEEEEIKIKMNFN